MLYTDGVIEHGRDVLAGERLLMEVAAGAREADDVARAIYDRVFGNALPRDDVAILAITFVAERDRAALPDLGEPSVVR